MSEALFVPEGERFLPTELCRGPWSPDAQHGGPPAALLARAVERLGGGDGMQVARLTVELLRPVPATDWIRLRVPLVVGERTSPLSRVAAAADFGNGVSWVLPRAHGYRFINPDLTIYLHRLPIGEWVCLEALTTVEPHGIGLAESRLWDERGPLGRVLQSLLLEGPGG